MPRVRRRAHRQRAAWTDQHRMHLQRGYSFFAGEGFARNPDIEQVRAAWNDLRDEIMAAWIEQRPGTRPWGWWAFDGPGRRERIDGSVHPFDKPNFQGERRLSFGKPATMRTVDDFEAVYESEVDYLRRHDLLEPSEAEALAAEV